MPSPASGEAWQLGGDDDEADGWGGERDTEPTPPRRPKRFDDWGAGGSSWPQRLEGGGRRVPLQGGEGGQLSEEQTEEQRKQRQLAAAVRKLEKMGAQVGSC